MKGRGPDDGRVQSERFFRGKEETNKSDHSTPEGSGGSSVNTRVCAGAHMRSRALHVRSSPGRLNCSERRCAAKGSFLSRNGHVPPPHV